MVPDPMTRSGGTPYRLAMTVTILVTTSTGLVAIRKIGCFAAANTAGTMPAENFGVSRQEVQPGLPGPLAGARSEDDDLRAVEIGHPAGAEPDGMGEGRALQDVARLRRRQIRIEIDEDDLRAHAAHHHGVGGSRSDLSGADDPDLHACLRSHFPAPPRFVDDRTRRFDALGDSVSETREHGPSLRGRRPRA